MMMGRRDLESPRVRTGRRRGPPRLWVAPRNWRDQTRDPQSTRGPLLQLIVVVVVLVRVARLGKRVLASPQEYEMGIWDHERPPGVPVGDEGLSRGRTSVK
jgi:hypothetical protein